MSGYYGLGSGLHGINSPTRPSEKVGGLVQQFPSAAAYSLRGLISNASKVVRVRRGADNRERDFSASEVESGALTSFVNEAISSPLDLKALDANGERTGAVIPAAAAYSLRNLKSAGTAVTSDGDTGGDTSGNYVIQVQRSSDSEIKSFTASEVTDGTLVNYVKANSAVLPIDEDQANAMQVAYGLRNLSATGTEVTTEGDSTGVSSDNYVVQVRRNSDNKVRSFTAAEVGTASSSTLKDFVNESFAEARPLDTASDAAVGYSLRNLKLGGTTITTSGDTGDQRTDKFVVQVRRSGTDTIKSFTAAEVADGTLTSFVLDPREAWNVEPSWSISPGNIISQSTTPTSATVTFFAYGTAHNISDSSSPLHIKAEAGDTISVNLTVSGLKVPASIQIRQGGNAQGAANINNGTQTVNIATAGFSGDVGNFAFTGIETGDDFSNGTITFNSIQVISQTGFVTTWYDQSGNNNHAVQTNVARQPKVVTSGAFNASGGIEFASPSKLSLTSSIGFQNTAGTVIALQDAQTSTNNFTLGVSNSNRGIGFGTSSSRWYFTASQHSISHGSTVSGLNLFSLIHDGTANNNNITSFLNGAQTGTASGGANVATLGNQIGARMDVSFLTGTVKEILIYKNDQSDKRIAIEQNIAVAYGLTINHQRDGFVRTLYDQSTNQSAPAHAKQTSNALQPKIVVNGVLQTGLNSKPCVNFTASEGHFLQATLASNFQGATAFGLVTTQCSTSANNGHPLSLSHASANDKFFALKEDSGQSILSLSNTAAQSVAVTASTTTRLSRFETSGATSYKVATNGGAYTSASTSYGSGIGSGDAFNTIFIGKSKPSDDSSVSGAMFNGSFHESILLSSLPGELIYNAFESNIGTEFNISSAKKEDASVRNWYDQSGNNHHVKQTTVSQQPTLVISGALLSAGVTFDETRSTELVATSPVMTASNTGTYSGFSVQTISNSESGYVYGNASPSNGSSVFAQSSTYQVTNKNQASGFDGITKGSIEQLLSVIYNNNDATMQINGSGTASNGSTYNFAAGTANFRMGNRSLGTSTGTKLSGAIKEVIVYNSDQTDNKTSFESNIAEHYNIALPAGFDSKNNTVSGFVTTWYDQSGNGLHAVQTTDARQPIIVENGTFQNGIKFTHTDTTNGKRLFFDKTAAQLGTEFAFVWVGTYSGSSGFSKTLLGSTRNVSGRNAGSIGLSVRPASNNFRLTNESTSSNSGVQTLISSGTIAADTRGVVFASYDDDAVLISVNGTANTSTFSSTVLTSTRKFNIMNSTATNGTYRTQESPEGIISEAIVFDTNQVTNRAAIEANIINHYSIS